MEIVLTLRDLILSKTKKLNYRLKMKKFLLLMSAAAVSLSGMAFVKAPKLNQGQNYAIDGKVKQQLISASAANVVS